MSKFSLHPIRRVVHTINQFTLVTMNPTSPFSTPYTGQISKVLNGPRV
jgi:hypothetical protein